MRAHYARGYRRSVNAANLRNSLHPGPRALRFETMESRRLLSVINWSNEGNAGNDSDGFNAVFGANAAQARLIVERAILDWEEVIVDFHHTGGGNTYSLQV